MLKFASICPHPPLLIPSIGKRNQNEVASTIKAMEDLAEEIKNLGIETIAVISPHGPVQMDEMTLSNTKKLRGDFGQFGDGTTIMEFENDLGLIVNIKKLADAEKIPVSIINGSMPLDHGTMVPLYFLTKYSPQIKIVPITFSYLDYQTHFEFGEVIYEVMENSSKKIAFVASGDLSHRLTPDAPAGFSSRAKEFDELLIKFLENRETAEILNLDANLIEEAGECGLRSIIVLLGVLSNLDYKFEKLSYEKPFGVGYLTAKFGF